MKVDVTPTDYIIILKLGCQRSYLARTLCLVLRWHCFWGWGWSTGRAKPHIILRSRQINPVGQHLRQLLQQLVMVFLCDWMMFDHRCRGWGWWGWRRTGYAFQQIHIFMATAVEVNGGWRRWIHLVIHGRRISLRQRWWLCELAIHYLGSKKTECIN